MPVQTLLPHEEDLSANNSALENARIAHQRYLIKQQPEDIDRAIVYYVEAIKFNPDTAEAYYRLASLMWEKGQITATGAIEQCITSVHLEPDNVNAHLYLGYFYAINKEFKEAEEEFKIAIKCPKSNSARARIFLSNLMRTKMDNEGKNLWGMLLSFYYSFTGTILLTSDYPSLKMLSASIFDNLSVVSYRTIGKIFERIKMFPSALKMYDNAIKATEHGEIFYKKLGDVSLECNNITDSIKFYKNALKKTPCNRELLLKLVTVIQTYYPDEVDTVINYYTQLLDFGIDNEKIYYELGHLYLKKDDRINSVSAFKLALEMDPENPYYNNSLAYALVRAELYDDAVEYYQKAILLNPDACWTSIVCHALGALYAEIKGNFDAAEATFQAGMVLDVNNYDLLLSLGDLYMAKYDLDKAIKTYCDGITMQPDNFIAYSKAGLALWEKDYIEEALVSLHKATTLNPDYDISHNNLGVVYLDGIGDAKESIQYFKRAIEINPNYTLAYFNTGRAYQALEDKASAAQYYQMAIDLNNITHEMDEDDIKDRLHGLFD